MKERLFLIIELLLQIFDALIGIITIGFYVPITSLKFLNWALEKRGY